LLVDDSWRECAAGFADVDAFLESLQLDQFAKITEEKREIAKLIKELRPEVSTRAIGRALKVKQSTMRRLVNQNGSAKSEKTKQNNVGVNQSGPAARGAFAPVSAGTSRCSTFRQIAGTYEGRCPRL
jgi:hypothetical protein